ncbi:MAG TPA: transposase [Chthoniobacterales bacterium]
MNFAEADCNPELFDFSSLNRRKVEASFEGGDLSSDGGVMLLRQVDRRLGLTAALDLELSHDRLHSPARSCFLSCKRSLGVATLDAWHLWVAQNLDNFVNLIIPPQSSFSSSFEPED